MKKTQRIQLQHLHHLGEITCQLSRVEFAQFARGKVWRPAVNAYRCEDRFEICVDLAGVEHGAIDVHVEPRRLVLRGHRQPPEPKCTGQHVEVYAMEIDYGDFEREVLLPADVDPQRARAEHVNGLLWVRLPMRADG